ncbi:MAG: outer membrane protein assembly factor BamD [Desulfomonilaceae bacterium]|nr:outer membrane protein assembly factor BamD [Desulfomonilaceae bacterium]
MLKSLILMVLTVITAGVLAGCPSLWNSKVGEEAPGAGELYEKAEARFKDKDYPGAIEAYQRLRSAHPDFDKAPEVSMKIADATYESGDLEKAASAYLQFVELYPGHEEAARAKYQVAMCYFRQIKNTDLDSRAVMTAAERFKALRDNPDAGEWATKAGEKFDECMKKLAEKELYKARTYISMGKYKSARLAAKRVLEEYGKLGLDQEAEDLIKRIKGK